MTMQAFKNAATYAAAQTCTTTLTLGVDGVEIDASADSLGIRYGGAERVLFEEVSEASLKAAIDACVARVAERIGSQS